MVSAGSLGRFELAAINPLLQRRIADAEDVGRFARCEKLLQGAPLSKQNTALPTATSIRLCTLLAGKAASCVEVCRSLACARCAPAFSFRRRATRRLRAPDPGGIVH